MAKAKIGAAGIEYIQGALKKPVKKAGHNHGNYLIATHRTAETTSNDCQRLYVKDSDAYQRSTPVSQDELVARERFTQVRRLVSARAKNLATITTDQAAYAAQKDSPNGKKTWKSYLWYICGEEYDQAHPQG